MWPEEMAEISLMMQPAWEVKTGDKVRVTSRRGELTSKVQVTDRVPPGLIWMSFHFAESPANVLTE